MIRNLLLTAVITVIGIQLAYASEPFKQIVRERAERIDVIQRAIPARLEPMLPLIDEPPPGPERDEELQRMRELVETQRTTIEDLQALLESIKRQDKTLEDEHEKVETSKDRWTVGYWASVVPLVLAVGGFLIRLPHSSLENQLLRLQIREMEQKM